MDLQLAMIMANLGQVQNGHLVVDPFVGTGNGNWILIDTNDNHS